MSISSLSSRCILNVVTLSMGLQLKLRHENGDGPKNCLGNQAHFHKCGKMQGIKSQEFSNEKHFGSCNITKVLNFWNEIANNKCRPN
jgi:hypothetical protein